MVVNDSTVEAIAQRVVSHRFLPVAVTVLVGLLTGFWVGYALIYPFSSLPLPRFAFAGVFVFGIFLDYYARSMMGRLAMLFGAAFLAYIVAFVVFSMPALLGWYTDPSIRQGVYLAGLKRTFLFWTGALMLLIAGTFGSYVVRGSIIEFTR